MSDSSGVSQLDIPFDKLAEWSVARGQLTADWLPQLKAVQAKVKNTVAHPDAQIPVEVQRHMEKSGLTYWSCLSGLSMLSAQLLRQRGLTPGVDDGKLKNFFGRYIDVPLKALHALAQLYRPGHLYLAEGAQKLGQAVKYDLPQLRKTVASSVKQGEDLARRIAEEGRHARDVRTKLAAQLKEQWGVASMSATTADLTAAIARRAQADVPALLNEVLAASKEAKLAEALDYYDAFVKFSVPSAAAGESALSTIQAVRVAEMLPVIEDDSAAVAASSDATAAAAPAADGGIDWGISLEDAGESGATGATIDWGITSDGGGEAAPAGDAAPAAGGIDWGEESAPAADASASIDWGIETTESGSAAADSTAASSSPSAAAASPSSSSPGDLSSSVTRLAFLSELLELEAFLSERAHDLTASSSGGASGAGDELAAAAFQGAGVPHLLSLQSAAGVAAYLASVRKVLSLLRGARLTQLLLLRSSPRAVERVAQGLRLQLTGLERLERSQLAHESRRAELARVVSRSAVELAELVEQTKQMKKDVEQAVSALFQNRSVNLTGEIHQALA